MTFDSLIYLLTPDGEPVITAGGDRLQLYKKEERLCEVNSVKMAETYKALAVGLQPEIVITLADKDEYAGQEFLEYEGYEYTVLRAYAPPEKRTLEIIAHKKRRAADG